MAEITGLALGSLGSTSLAMPGDSDQTHEPNQAQESSMPNSMDQAATEPTADQMGMDRMDMPHEGMVEIAEDMVETAEEMVEMAKSHDGTRQLGHAACSGDESMMSGMMSGIAQSDMSPTSGDHGTMMPTP